MATSTPSSRTLTIIACAALSVGSFALGYWAHPELGAYSHEPLPTQSDKATANHAHPAAEQAPESVTDQSELDRLKSELANERARLAEAHSELKKLEHKKASYDWIREQIDTNNLSALYQLNVSSENFVLSDNFINLLALSEKQHAAIDDSSEKLLADVKAWEFDNAVIKEGDDPNTTIFEIPTVPPEYTERFLSSIQKVLSEEDFRAFEKVSKRALESLSTPTELKATLVISGKYERLTIKTSQIETGSSSSSTSQYPIGETKVSSRWNHLIELGDTQESQ